MAVPVYSLLTIDEAKAAVKLQSVDATVVARLELLCGWVTDMLENLAETQFVERAATALVEIHDLAVPQGFLQVRRTPIIAMTSVGVADPVQVLPVANYYVDAARGLIMMKGGSANARYNRRPPSMWAMGNPTWVDFPEDYYTRLSGSSFPGIPQSATVTYRGGYATTAGAPGELKLVASNVLARWWRQEERKSQGLSAEMAQGFTFMTKFENKLLSAEDREMLMTHGNLSRTARVIS